MPEATQTATPTDARQASMSRVQTQDSVIASLAPQKAASVPADGKPDAEKDKDEGNPKPKKTPNERFQELANKRREAEAEADAARREAAELRAKVQALETGAKPMEAAAKPMRVQYASDDDYIEALSDWKAKEAIAKREQEQVQARIEAEQAEINERWTKRQEKVMKAIPDYEEIVRSSNVPFPNHVIEDLQDSDFGPQIVYFLALNPDEAKSLSQMKRGAATRRIHALERDMAEIEADDGKPAPKKADETPKPQRSKAPEPIEPVKSVPSASGSSGTSFDEYRRRRQAEKGK